MSNSGDILKESQEDPENTMAFKLESPMKEEEKKEGSDDPMWFSSSSGQMDWFYTEQ